MGRHRRQYLPQKVRFFPLVDDGSRRGNVECRFCAPDSIQNLRFDGKHLRCSRCGARAYVFRSRLRTGDTVTELRLLREGGL